MRYTIAVLILGLMALSACAPAPESVERPPNIVLILADDFGVGDIQAHYPDNKIATPHLDRLVSEGLSFTDAHSPSAVCTPTRYGILTGRYAWRTRLQEWVLGAYEPPLIAEDRPTVPQFLRDKGYQTVCIGKWHLGFDWQGPQEPQMTVQPNAQKTLSWDFTKPMSGGPVHRGFDYYFGVDLPNMPPFTYIEDDRVLIQPTTQYEYDPDEGVVMPRGFDGSPMAPDWKFDQILPEITRHAVEQIKERAQQEQPFFLYFSMTSPHEPVVPSADFKGASGIAPIADFVMETDWSAGQLINAVDEAGIADDTIVIFTADNGHSHYTGWDELVAAGHKPSGPYRGTKSTIWEGGHRVPLVIRWPGHVASGASDDQLVSLTDFFATFAELLDGDLPGAGVEDSQSFLPSLTGEPGSAARTSLVSHSVHGEFAYRDGDWKLVYRMADSNRNKARGQPTVAELYNLADDIAEANDLAAERPEIVQRMEAQLKETIDRGASAPGRTGANDTDVRYDVTQTERWAAPAQ